MSQPVLSVLRGRSSVIFRHAVLAAALCGSVQVATASTTVDQLSNCLVKSTTATDKTTVLQWTFAALAAHPDLKVYSNVTDAQRTQLDKASSSIDNLLQFQRNYCKNGDFNPFLYGDTLKKSCAVIDNHLHNLTQP